VRFALTVLVILISVLGCPQARAAERVALVIGNSKYENVARLDNPSSDAELVAARFKMSGFNVTLKQDLGIVELRRAIRAFSDIAQTADFSVVYYAGHGIEIDGANYLIPTDAKLRNDLDVEDETMSLDRVIRTLDGTKRLKLVILDACRDNPFAQKMKRSVAARSVGRGLSPFEPAASNMLVAFAAKAGSVASDGDGEKNSPFAASFVKYVFEPGLDLRLAFGRVRDDVLKKTSQRQEPFVYGSLGGETLALVPLASEPQDTQAVARADYALAANIGTVEAWDSYLAQHGSGLYANLARAQKNKVLSAVKEQRYDVPAAPPIAATPSSVPPPKSENNNSGVASLNTETVLKSDAVVQKKDDDLVRLLQSELKRVGCEPGMQSDTWSKSSEAALAAFNKIAHTNYPTKIANVDALEGIRLKTDRVCPLECTRTEHLDGDRCVKTLCSAEQFLNSNGSCEKKPEARDQSKKQVVRSSPPEFRKKDVVTTRTEHPARAQSGRGCFQFNGGTYCE
jgi:uncharacterized caspase-like protein